jgi:hypothetical protein
MIKLLALGGLVDLAAQPVAQAVDQIFVDRAAIEALVDVREKHDGSRHSGTRAVVIELQRFGDLFGGLNTRDRGLGFGVDRVDQGRKGTHRGQPRTAGRSEELLRLVPRSMASPTGFGTLRNPIFAGRCRLTVWCGSSPDPWGMTVTASLADAHRDSRPPRFYRRLRKPAGISNRLGSIGSVERCVTHVLNVVVNALGVPSGRVALEDEVDVMSTG